jgi:hypothetical protein
MVWPLMSVGRNREHRPAWQWTVGALAFYALAAILLFGPPLIGHSGEVMGANPSDSRLFTWALAWWPHAIGHGVDPLTTDRIFTPDGYHLMWTSSVPGVALVLWPITALFGAATTYNVAMVAAPALAAWTAFLLCRHVSGRPVPSLLGGWLFGFSSYMLGTVGGGHLHVALVFLLPLAGLLALRHAEGATRTRTYVILLALLLIAQFSISTEITLTLALMGGGLLIAAWIVFPGLRPRLTETIKWTIVAGIIAGVVLSPLLLSTLASGVRPPVAAETGVVDFLNPIFPTALTWAGHSTFADVASHYTGDPNTRGGYLGIALILLVWLWAATQWRERSRHGLLLLGFGLVAMIFAFGPGLKVMGIQTVLMPWYPFEHLPLTRYVLAYRFMAYVTLAIAIAATLWLSRERGVRAGRASWALALIAVAITLPTAGAAVFHHTQTVPAFFTSDAYQRYIKPTDRVFALPYGPYGASMAWQQAADFDFQLVGGYAEPPPESYELPVIQNLGRAGTFSPADTQALRDFLKAKGATVIVVDAADPGPGTDVLKALGVHGTTTDGVIVGTLPSGD